MSVPVIRVVNKATVPLGVDFSTLVSAGQKYISLLQPFWPRNAHLIPAAEVPTKGWAIVFLDDADAPDALGYHELTANGQPLAKVFVKTALANGEKPSVTFAHELAEMLVDPYATDLVMDDKTGDVYPKEVADPVEEDTFLIDNISFSNFVLPAWFYPWLSSRRFDFLGTLKSAYSLAPGGYASLIRAGQFTQIFGSEEKSLRFAKEDRRQHRTETWVKRLEKQVL